MNIQEATEKIKASKKYRHLSLEFIKQKAEEYAGKNKLAELEEVDLKEIKANLHKMHGSFRIGDKKLSQLISGKDYQKALASNISTRERLEDYDEIYRKIFEITGKPKKIIDLGCGINPVSIPFMKLNHRELEYYAYDINEAEILSLNEFFKLEKINGKAEILDLAGVENIKKLPSCDVCFMFKLVDVLEESKKGHKYSEEIIKILAEKCRFIVASFATRTLGGRKMMFAERGWIERMLNRIGMKFEKLEFENEIFYVVSKK